jgi:hypothetical protein
VNVLPVRIVPFNDSPSPCPFGSGLRAGSLALMGGGAQGLAAEPMTEKADAVEKRQRETIGLAGTAAYTVDVQRCAVRPYCRRASAGVGHRRVHLVQYSIGPHATRHGSTHGLSAPNAHAVGSGC